MILVEGNIGAGKSTFLSLLGSQTKDFIIAQEPVESWHKKEEGSNLLGKFYKEPQRWAYTLETFAMAARLQNHLEYTKANKPVIVERSIYSGHYCFAKNDFIAGYMSDVEWALYQQWFTTLVESFIKPPKCFIYLQVDPEIALERIKKRGRSGEETINAEYLKDIHQRHEEFLIQKIDLSYSLINVPVKVISVDEGVNQNTALEAINFIKNII